MFRQAAVVLALIYLGGEALCQDQATAPKIRFTIPADEALPGKGPMRRQDWFQNVWNQRKSTFAANAANSKGSVVFLGDSITQGWKDDFGGAFGDLPKCNRGISGDTTRGMLYRLNDDVLSLDPAVVVLLMGTNDLEEGASPETIASNMQEILAKLKEHDAEMPIVLCEVFPSSETKKRPSGKIKEINRLYRAVAAGDPQITVLDTWTLFADNQGDAKAAEFPDLLHPNKTGYGKWERALHPIFATLGFVDQTPDAFDLEPNARSLFNGQDLTGWGFQRTPDAMRKSRARWMSRKPVGIVWPLVDESIALSGMKQSPDGRYRAIAGRLVVTTPTEGRCIQQLWTTDEFNDDFQLKLEFRATPVADSGVFLRGKQLQCRDFPLAGPYKSLQKFNEGGWTELVVTVKGNVARCLCNGEVLEEALEIPATGKIGLEGDRGQIEYRRIRVLTP